MTTVNSIATTLDDWFPQELAESWDNTGLLIGDRESPVKKVLTTLTLTEDVAIEACDEGVDFIVSHHPILFRGAKQLTADTPEGRIVLMLAKANVAVYSPHTRFDSASAGINQYLAERLGLNSIEPMRPSDDVSESVGGGRYGIFSEPISVTEFASSVASVCQVDGLHVVDGGPTVQRVAIACGAAGEFLDDAIAARCDAFVVGECRFHAALEARAAGISLFVPGHFGSERPAVEWLAGRIADEFDDVACFASRVETDPLRWHR